MAALRFNRNCEPRMQAELIDLGMVQLSCSFTKGGYVLRDNEPVLPRTPIREWKLLEVDAKQDDGSFTSWGSEGLFDWLESQGWPIMRGGTLVTVANGQTVPTGRREVLVEVSLTTPSGDRRSKEILLGELEMSGGVTLTLGRNCTAALELHMFLARKAVDIQQWNTAMVHATSKLKQNAFHWWHRRRQSGDG